MAYLTSTTRALHVTPPFQFMRKGWTMVPTTCRSTLWGEDLASWALNDRHTALSRFFEECRHTWAEKVPGRDVHCLSAAIKLGSPYRLLLSRRRRRRNLCSDRSTPCCSAPALPTERAMPAPARLYNLLNSNVGCLCLPSHFACVPRMMIPGTKNSIM